MVPSGSAAAFEKLAAILEKRYTGTSSSSRVILVLGSAVSSESGLRDWPSMKEDLFKVAEDSFENEEAFTEEVWTRLRPKIGLRIPEWSHQAARERILAQSGDKELVTTSMICSVASRFDIIDRRIRERLRQKFAKWENEPDTAAAGAPPQISYELIAHLVKHGFVDHIVTFNFDELADTALRNELGDDGIEIIISDKQLLPAGPPQKPLLIKLHGSVSSPQSLRFTDDETGVLSDDMIDLLDFMLTQGRSGRTREDMRGLERDDQEPSTGKVHLISLGYSWKDRDFAHWVVSRGEQLSDITVVKWSAEIPVALLEQRREARERDPTSSKLDLTVLSNEELFERREAGSVDNLLWALWRHLETKFTEDREPFVPIARHLLLGHLFKTVDHTLRGRLYAELFLHLVKCKGMVNASVMAKDPRIHRYFERYKVENSNPTPILDQFDFWKESPFPDVKDTYFADASTPKCLFGLFNDQNIFREHDVLIPRFDRANSKIKCERPTQQPRDHRAFWREMLQRVYEGPEVEIDPASDTHVQWLFEDPQFLRTYRELQVRTMQLLRESWSHLLVIAETGEWLTDDHFFDLLHSESSGREILLITASRESTEQWMIRDSIDQELGEAVDEMKDKGVETAIEGLPWWDHNRHMTLVVDAKHKVFRGGIFFRRTHKMSRISPVYLKATQDCTELLFTFLSYVKRASDQATENPSDSSKQNLTVRSCALVLAKDILESFNLDEQQKERLKLLIGQLDDGS